MSVVYQGSFLCVHLFKVFSQRPENEMEQFSTEGFEELQS